MTALRSRANVPLAYETVDTCEVKLQKPSPPVGIELTSCNEGWKQVCLHEEPETAFISSR